MTSYRAEMDVRFIGSLDDFDERTDRLMDALQVITAVQDADLSVNLKSGDVEVHFLVEAETLPDAAATTYTAIREAIHAIGDTTEGWQDVAKLWDEPDGLNLVRCDPATDVASEHVDELVDA